MIPFGNTRAGLRLSIRSVPRRNLGQLCGAAHKALGLTQAELALAAGVGLRFVGEVEAGKPSAQLGRVMQLIEALGGSLVLRSAPAPSEA
jgi:HTH-type transcriptional regulator / antitoxin HipB